MPDKSARRRPQDMAERMARLMVVPETDQPDEQPEPPAPAEQQPAPAEQARPVRKPRAARPARATAADVAQSRPSRRAPMPDEQPKRAAWEERIPFTTNREQSQALKQARLDDGIQATARLRAMVALWMEDDRIRARVNKLALGYRDGPR